MTIQEIWVSSVDVARLHSYQVFDQLVGGIHNLLEEGNDHSMELFLQLRVSSEELLAQ